MIFQNKFALCKTYFEKNCCTLKETKVFVCIRLLFLISLSVSVFHVHIKFSTAHILLHIERRFHSLNLSYRGQKQYVPPIFAYFTNLQSFIRIGISHSRDVLHWERRQISKLGVSKVSAMEITKSWIFENFLMYLTVS